MNRKILIVGCGSIGKRHLANLLKIGYKDIVLCDSHIRKIKGLPKSLPQYSDINKALRSERPNTSFVCSPTSLHIKHLKQCLLSDCDVFVEKPLSFSTKGVQDTIKLSNQKRKIVMVACNWRFNDTFYKLRDLTKKNKFGKTISASIIVSYSLPQARGKNWAKSYAARKLGGGVLLDTGSHVIDYLEDLFGQIVDIRSIKSPYHPLKTGVDEQAMMLIKHKNEIICNVYMDYFSTEPIHTLKLNTLKGELFADLRYNEISFKAGGRNKIIFKSKNDLNQMYIKELKHFFLAVDNKVHVLQDLFAASRVMRLLAS